VLAYLVRRLLYAIPILIGVNLITFALFFFVNSPDDMARMQLGQKRVTPEAIQKWKEERGYNRPMLFNAAAKCETPLFGWSALPKLCHEKLTDTIFFDKSASMFWFDFGRAEIDGRDIAREIRLRMGPSLAVTIPAFLIGLAAFLTFALILAFFRATYVDFLGVVMCVAAMSISVFFYIIGGQWLISKLWHLVPISGFGYGLDAWRFVVLPVALGVLAGVGGSTRLYRTIFLEEIGKDYVRTARAKGLAEGRVLSRHVLRNGLIPVLTGVVVAIPTLFIGSLVFESFFGIPGLGSYTIEAIRSQDFLVVRAMVFLGAVLYIVGLILTDISYTLADPRVRFQ
jgi:peptide/nickel transport system permease protein